MHGSLYVPGCVATPFCIFNGMGMGMGYSVTFRGTVGVDYF